MLEKEVTPSIIGAYYATEHPKLPELKCPHYEHANPLGKLVANKQCENCGGAISLRLEAAPEPELSTGAEMVLRHVREKEAISIERLKYEMGDRIVDSQRIDGIIENLEEKELITTEDESLRFSGV